MISISLIYCFPFFCHTLKSIYLIEDIHQFHTYLMKYKRKYFVHQPAIEDTISNDVGSKMVNKVE